MQLTAAIATDRDQGGARDLDMILPQADKNAVDETGARVHQVDHGLPVGEALLQVLARTYQ